MQKLKITCDGVGARPIEEFEDFQGDLKNITIEKMLKLKANLRQYGFSFPVAVWRNKIIDGHQRLRAARALKDEGYEIPAIPYIEVHAKNEKEAKAKVLLAASTYGKVTEEGLADFMIDAELHIEDVAPFIEFHGIDITPAEGFNPNLNPDADNYNVTDEDIEKTNGSLQGRFANQKLPERVEFDCPNCGHSFEMGTEDAILLIQRAGEAEAAAST